MPTTSPGVDRLLDIFSRKKKKTEAPKRRTKKELPKAFDRPKAKSKSPTKEQMAKGKRNRQALMSKMEAMGKADKAKEDARKAKAKVESARKRVESARKKAESAKKDKASGIGAVKSPVGTKVDKGFTPGKIRSVGKASTKKAESKKTEPKKTQEKTTPAKVKVTGRGGRNVGTGENKKANVTREQLKASGVGLTAYLNKFDELGKRPKPSDFKKKTEQKPFDPTKPNTGGGPGFSSIKPPKRQSAMAAAAAMGARPEDEMGMKYGGMKKMRAGGMKSKMGTKGGAMGGKKKMAPGMMGGGMKSKMSTKGGAMGGKKKMAPGMKAGGLKPAPEGNKGLKKLPKEVRNKMGFMKGGGKVKPKGAAAGGGYKKGGMKPKTTTKKKVSKAKVRGAGIARKGVRPVKFR